MYWTAWTLDLAVTSLGAAAFINSDRLVANLNSFRSLSKFLFIMLFASHQYDNAQCSIFFSCYQQSQM